MSFNYYLFLRILLLMSTFCREIGSLLILFWERLSANSDVSILDGSLQAKLKLNTIKSLFGSGMAFQKLFSSHAAIMTKQEFDQSVIDLIAINMLFFSQMHEYI